MVLGSQSPRSALSQRHMTTRRKRGLRSPLRWGLPLVLGLLLGGIYLFWNTGETTPEVLGEPPAGPQPAAIAAGRVPNPAAKRTEKPTDSNPSASATTPPAPNLLVRDTPPTTPPPTPTLTLDVPQPTPNPTPRNPQVLSVSPTSTNPSIAEAMNRGMADIEDNQPIAARAVLSALLFDRADELSPADAAALRETLTRVNAELLFSDRVLPDDPLVQRYQVQPGDLLGSIARRANVPYPFLEQINNLKANRLQVGQPIKLVNGPFHARVDKRTFLLDLYLVDPDGRKIYAATFPVGLGEADSTPVGDWRIKPRSKVTNPDWRNPRTGQYYPANAEDIPIGEYWLALEGTDDHTRGEIGYGIHGTNDPDSIGKAVSMGCIRLRDADIAQLYNMLTDGNSTVQVVE